MSYLNNSNFKYYNTNSPKLNLYNRCSDLSYTGEQRLPQGEEVMGSTWPLCFLERSCEKMILTLY